MFPVVGMTCASCANSVETMIGAQADVREAAVNYADQTAKVTYDPLQVRMEASSYGQSKPFMYLPFSQ